MNKIFLTTSYWYYKTTQNVTRWILSGGWSKPKRNLLCFCLFSSSFQFNFTLLTHLFTFLPVKLEGFFFLMFLCFYVLCFLGHTFFAEIASSKQRKKERNACGCAQQTNKIRMHVSPLALNFNSSSELPHPPLKSYSIHKNVLLTLKLGVGGASQINYSRKGHNHLSATPPIVTGDGWKLYH